MKDREYEAKNQKFLKANINSDITEQGLSLIRQAIVLCHARSVQSLNAFFTSTDKKRDSYLCDDGLVQLQMTIEYLIKGILCFYWVPYEEVHNLESNLRNFRENLLPLHPELDPIARDIITLSNKDIIYELDSWYNFGKYYHIVFKKHLLKIIQRIANSMVNFVNSHPEIFTTDDRVNK